MKKTCLNCGMSFTAVNNNQIYCNPSCRSQYYYSTQRYRAGKEYTPRKNINCNSCLIKMKKNINKYICPKCNKVLKIDSLGRVVYLNIKMCKDCKHNDLELIDFGNHDQICLKGRCMYCRYLGKEECEEWRIRG